MNPYTVVSGHFTAGFVTTHYDLCDMPTVQDRQTYRGAVAEADTVFFMQKDRDRRYTDCVTERDSSSSRHCVLHCSRHVKSKL
jgi:hypothetical protein